jgi:hypothetical protein
MNRRDFLRLGAGVPFVVSIPGFAAGAEHGDSTDRPQQPLAPLSDVDAFNYVIGTQTIGATYKFTQESVLVETARAILDMGSNILKITMGRDYRRMMLKATQAAYPETMQYLLNEGSDAKGALRRKYPGASIEPPPADPHIQTLTDLARLEPSYRQVFEMPFAYYLIWTYAFAPCWWHRGFSPENQEKEYQEIRQFVSHLLRTYDGTGKTFFVGHWEGDWHLRPSIRTDSDKEVTAESIQGMTDWLNTRQKAVDDAKRQTPHHGVQVWHYSEVNHVTAVSMAGRPSVTNSILPKTNVDYVSYSTYDSLGDIPKNLPKALSYIESKLPPKPGFDGKRVFIGEYGFPARRVPEAERDRKSRQVMRVGLQWGCPFILCWQMYNNEFSDGQQNGYWLIDDKGVKQPLWHTHHEFYQKSRRYVIDFRKKEGRLPTSEEFRRFGLGILDVAPKQAD